ncbi:IS110 family transposase [Burkholderia sp. JPY481]
MQNLLGAARFANLTVAEHHDPIGHLRDHRQIVRHIDGGHSALPDHAAKRLQHVDLRRDVERRGRLVEDHEGGVGDQRHRRHQPLQLAARHLVRVTLADLLRVRQRERAEQFDGFCLRGALAERAVNQRAFDHLVHDRARRVERGRRALRDIGNLAATQSLELIRRESEHVGVADPDRAARDAAAAASMAHQRQRDRGLARARFADQGEHLAARNLEVDVVHDPGIRIGEIDRELAMQLADNDLGQRLLSIPGVGPVTASVLAAEIGDGKQYASSRDFAASIGLVPPQYSTGGRTNLLGISKRGDANIRRLLVQCARTYMHRVSNKAGPLAEWVRSMLARRHSNVVACALANKFARIAWALSAHHASFTLNTTMLRPETSI